MILWPHNYFLSRHAVPSIIHCCKRPKYDFYISQGSVATVLMLDGQNYGRLCHSLRCCMPKIIKFGIRPMFHVVIHKITLAQFFWDTVYNVCSCGLLSSEKLIVEMQCMPLAKYNVSIIKNHLHQQALQI